jgi:hypothetical protein
VNYYAAVDWACGGKECTWICGETSWRITQNTDGWEDNIKVDFYEKLDHPF